MFKVLKAWGAEVTATCSTDAVQIIQNLGADNVLDYQDPEFKTQLRHMKGYGKICSSQCYSEL